MTVIVVVAALCLLMFIAYKGFSVILFAPIVALLAVFCTSPHSVMPVYTNLFMDSMSVFVKNYFPVFMLGAVFGKLIEISGYAKSITNSVVKLLGPSRAMLAIAFVGALLTYGGVSLFVVVFAIYPFAVELFREVNIPKRLIPAVIVLGGCTFTMDALPGTPQIQNIIPTTFFKTTAYSAPILGIIGAIYILVVGMLYLEWRRRQAMNSGEGYGSGHILEPEPIALTDLTNPYLAVLPLFVVGIMNIVFTRCIPKLCGDSVTVQLTSMAKPFVVPISKVLGLWSVEAAMVLGILTVVICAWKKVHVKFVEGTKLAIGGALLATLNTASEYGYGSVIAALPGFLLIRDGLQHIPTTLVKEAVSVNVLAGIVGSASGGMSIALAAMSDQFIASANAAHIPMEVLHRVAAMASGGMDSLPHNGVVITLLAVCGLTHKQSYKDIFAITCIKTSAVFVVIGVYYLTHLV
jgi:H+/gluconate symporter-like permease